MASLSFSVLGKDRFKIRWREKVPGPDGRPFRCPDGRWAEEAKSLTVTGAAARHQMMAEILRALETTGTYVPPTAAPVPKVANMETAAVAWTSYKLTKCAKSSVARYAQHMKLFFATVRAQLGLGADEVVRASVLSRDLLITCWRVWQNAGRSESYIYGAARSVLDMWEWVADDPAQYPGVPAPPRSKKAVLPQPPLYFPPPAPTLAEADACLRYISLDAVESRRIGAFMRCTGLRIDQVIQIRRRDIDFDAGTLTITTGKTRSEKAERRTVPLARALRREFQPWAADLPLDAWLFPARGEIGSDSHAAPRSAAFHAAWEEATKWGETREVVWKPENRKNARPEQVFRAGLQAYLQGRGVEEVVIDALVGHTGKTPRARHYAGADALFKRMQTAVDLLPPIDWTGPRDRGTNIALAKRRQRDRRTAAQSTG